MRPSLVVDIGYTTVQNFLYDIVASNEYYGTEALLILCNKDNLTMAMKQNPSLYFTLLTMESWFVSITG